MMMMLCLGLGPNGVRVSSARTTSIIIWDYYIFQYTKKKKKKKKSKGVMSIMCGEYFVLNIILQL